MRAASCSRRIKSTSGALIAHELESAADRGYFLPKVLDLVRQHFGEAFRVGGKRVVCHISNQS